MIICHRCGVRLDDGSLYCEECGVLLKPDVSDAGHKAKDSREREDLKKVLEGKEAEIIDYLSQIIAGKKDANPVCPSCGAALPAGARFCLFCGAAVASGAAGTEAAPAPQSAPHQPPAPVPRSKNTPAPERKKTLIFWAIAVGLIIIGVIVALVIIVFSSY
jgi:uncharacterized membrane protein YvbJ